MDADNTRRRFLLGSALGLSSAWLALRWPAVVAAQQHAQRSVESGHFASFQFFSPQDALEIEAVAAQIIPSDDAPGAREVRVIYFIDRALTTFDVDKQLAYTQGLEDLQQKTLELFPVADGFSSLSSAQQIQLLTGIEHTGFFELVRLHTIMGYLSHPDHGGNHNQAGWKLIGFEDKMTYAPPFGYYDSEYKEH
jgi:gluconate 2-dehydrogenase gamma chain